MNDEFHKAYYGPYDAMEKNNQVTWLGLPVQKNPFDLMILQEIIYNCVPKLIIEGGTANGGSAKFMRSIVRAMGVKTQIVSVDVRNEHNYVFGDIQYVGGDMLDNSVVVLLTDIAKVSGPVMVILDDNHEKDHVLKEMLVYGPLVSPNQYMIVEDTNVNGHPVAKDHGPGPWEAVEEFLKEDDTFDQDRKIEHFPFTFNPGGYLRKRSSKCLGV